MFVEIGIILIALGALIFAVGMCILISCNVEVKIKKGKKFCYSGSVTVILGIILMLFGYYF